MAALDHIQAPPAAIAFPRRRTVVLALIWLAVLANAGFIVWLWVHGGNWTTKSSADVLVAIARITGLLSAYLALIQVALLARIPAVERTVGFDRLINWHRWNGHAAVDLLILHVFFSFWGYAQLDKISFPQEIRTMITGGIYPGMITATIGTVFLIGVAWTSIVIARRRLRYEWWYAVHLLAYAGIALGWFHQIPTGNELVLHPAIDWYWKSLYIATLAVIVVFRLVVPVASAFRYRLRVAEVVPEGPGVVSLHIAGRGLERLRAEPGQFFLWRFLTLDRCWTSHPFSLSAAPDGRTLRITVKALGDHSAKLAMIPVGTRVLTEGPFGVFTEAARRRERVLLVAGGIGITPIRALLEQVRGNAVVLYRVMHAEDIVFQKELDEIAERRNIQLEYVVGDHRTEEGSRLLDPAHLHELVPDIEERDVYVCGPPAMTDALLTRLREAGVSRSHIHAERFAL